MKVQCLPVPPTPTPRVTHSVTRTPPWMIGRAALARESRASLARAGSTCPARECSGSDSRGVSGFGNRTTGWFDSSIRYQCASNERDTRTLRCGSVVQREDTRFAPEECRFESDRNPPLAPRDSSLEHNGMDSASSGAGHRFENGWGVTAGGSSPSLSARSGVDNCQGGSTDWKSVGTATCLGRFQVTPPMECVPAGAQALFAKQLRLRVRSSILPHSAKPATVQGFLGHGGPPVDVRRERPPQPQARNSTEEFPSYKGKVGGSNPSVPTKPLFGFHPLLKVSRVPSSCTRDTVLVETWRLAQARRQDFDINILKARSMAGYPSDTRAIQVRVLCLQPTFSRTPFLLIRQHLTGYSRSHTHSRDIRPRRCSLMWRVSGDTARLITSPLEFDSRRRNHDVRQDQLPQPDCTPGTTGMTNERWRRWFAHPFEARKILVRFQVSRPHWEVE